MKFHVKPDLNTVTGTKHEQLERWFCQELVTRLNEQHGLKAITDKQYQEVFWAKDGELRRATLSVYSRDPWISRIHINHQAKVHTVPETILSTLNCKLGDYWNYNLEISCLPTEVEPLINWLAEYIADCSSTPPCHLVLDNPHYAWTPKADKLFKSKNP